MIVPDNAIEIPPSGERDRIAILRNAIHAEVRPHGEAVAVPFDPWPSKQMPVRVRLIDIGGAERLNAILHHAAAIAVENPDRQSGLVALPRDDLVFAVLGEKARPPFQGPVVDRLGIVGEQILDRLAHRHKPISSR